MRVPQVTERIKEAPVVVLRGMLAGIGQVLLITDKLRNKTAPEDEPAGPAPAQTAPGAEATAEPEAQASAAADVQAGATAEAEASAEPTAETDVAVEADGGSLPLDNYDQLTVPSLRARLRNLTAAQVAELAEYERAHAARPEVITMFERRIAKLAAEN